MERNRLLEVLICTYNERIIDAVRLASTFPTSVNIIISHQYNDEKYVLDSLAITKLNLNITYIKLFGVGLSKNRNFGINFCSADYIWILDDDVSITDSSVSIITQYISKLNNPDFITFKVNDPKGEGAFKSYSEKTFEHNQITVLNVCSIEIILSQNFLNYSKITLDERFGVGSTYPTGEENILLSDMLKSGAKGFFSPHFIVSHALESSGSLLGSSSMAYSKGSLFKRLFGFKSYIIIIYFSIKKYHEYKTHISFAKFFCSIIKGAYQFNSKTYNC
ncbi:glycosyltransferase [Gammaproteobacteria bacterium LSUCC0057]|uniref:Glycosyltransferase n=1 Tax=Gammaproteobacteria bacterium LSUCC0057 TaxID=2559237 RepID=A0A4Y8UIF8_9GAMM|nr:glycosyltransferase [Gammaproteobacteria bacterium LSUCC0057]